MTSTESPRRAHLVCGAAAVGLAAAALLAVHVPPPPAAAPTAPAVPAATGTPARQQSGPTRAGVRAPLAEPAVARTVNADADADATALAGGPR
ncbi:hypothetical protein [Kitasatospora sp. NPDC094011]|uniref:hypothetical protein n=1 Tax=Kitasatospora sp. NPDC094011 TaxID=3364090 RepID=UPI00381AF2F3